MISQLDQQQPQPAELSGASCVKASLTILRPEEEEKSISTGKAIR